MRTLIFATLTTALIQTAAAQEANKPAVPGDPPLGEATRQLTVKMIQKQLEDAGLADVKVSPDVHVVKARDKNGKQVVLVVDPRTMVAIPLMAPDSGTTGSDPEDEGEDRL